MRWLVGHQPVDAARVEGPDRRPAWPVLPIGRRFAQPDRPKSAAEEALFSLLLFVKLYPCATERVTVAGECSPLALLAGSRFGLLGPERPTARSTSAEAVQQSSCDARPSSPRPGQQSSPPLPPPPPSPASPSSPPPPLLSSSSSASLLTSLSSYVLLPFLPSSLFRLLPLSFLLAPCCWYLLVPQLAEAGWRVRFSGHECGDHSERAGEVEREQCESTRALAEPREASLPILSAEEF